MKISRILLTVLMILAMEAVVLAQATVTLTVDGGAAVVYDLQSMSVSPEGNISMFVASSGGGQTGDTNPPSQPSGLQATAQSSSGIALSWSSSTDDIGVTGYRIYRNGAYRASVATTSYSDSGLAASTNYCYTVQATDAAGNTSLMSAQACATTLSDGIGDGINPINMGGPYPRTTSVSIAGGQAGYYYFTTTTASTIVSIQMTTTDWTGNLDLMASNVAPPTCDQMTERYSQGTDGLWYGPVGTSNESLGLTLRAPAGTKVYVTICNRTSTTAGAKFYWTTY